MLYQPTIFDPRQGAAEERNVLSGVDWRGGVLLRSVNWLGDLLMTLPATWRLRQLLPAGVPLWALAPEGLAAIWNSAPWIDGVIPFAGRHPDKTAILSVRQRGFGLGVVMPNSLGSALDIWKCGIPRRAGRAGNLRSLLLTDRIRRWPRGKDAPKCHQLSYYLELMSLFGKVEFSAECPALCVSPDYAASLGIRPGAGWLALAPGAAFGPAKQWPPEKYARVAEAWVGRGGKVVLLGSTRDATATAEIARRVPGCLDLAGRTSLEQLMSVLAGTEAALANDSGTMHLAAALGVPGVAFFLSTDPMATGPLGAPWKLMVADVPCRPCFMRECPLAGAAQYACRRAVSVEDVIGETLALFPKEAGANEK